MLRREFATEEVEQAISAIAQCLGDNWVAVDLRGGGERLSQHQHPPGCPQTFKGKFNRRPVVKLQVKGKFKCGNPSCGRSWSSALALLLLSVQPVAGGMFRFSVTALEQGCQRCQRDVYARMYADEAGRVAEWLTDAYERGEYEKRQQRASNMRRPHDKQRCAACRAGLH
ncbi:hypothetical protein ABPG75_006892 [Micractinium tetrahymenae]